jgi:cytochrome oxidase Cu insertion factor (SCO1/SenC/PrrC family)
MASFSVARLLGGVRIAAMKALVGVVMTLALLAAGGALGQQSGGRHGGDLRMPDTLRVGDVAPDFKLRTKDGSREVQLSSFKGKRPVVLVFGSFT